ncbi:DNA photolyase family protein [Ancylobacter sp. A5.8]|uniref:cryptochrome/photolyase family protein n=1 Tax=Ancylobacter gelatini TaxID=2919920 RepID=UPI001F4DCC05|nr:deoxyribodipyrimidine photo-lyase [Ancylobacter gelatini]MCJ8143200.1 DNA photolyase family protein [Ancylobacter gelatini]
MTDALPSPTGRPDRPALVWLRDDLRLGDNPALAAAIASGRPVQLLYVLDEESPGLRPLGGAARWWLGRALAALERDIAAHGGRLLLRRGAAGAVIAASVKEIGAATVYWNRRYGAAEIAVDTALKAELRAQGVLVESFGATLLHEPWTVLTQARSPYKVFTPFFRAAASQPMRAPLPRPTGNGWLRPAADAPPGEALADWHLEPSRPDWAGGLREAWQPGEDGARAALHAFLDHGIHGYAQGRDVPGRANVSRLSPFLRFGHISPHQVLAALRHAEAAGEVAAPDAAKFTSEIYWREFCYHLMFHLSDIAATNIDRRFDVVEWRDDATLETAWRKGLTGYPIIDAGMRQLWRTGWMHNRVRMLAASFLIKHGLTDWRHGERWFWDTLVDADAANNPAGWQWVAGCGADAAPWFRIFNPVTQGEKFDPEGAYVREFVPELAGLPPRLIHRPWDADAATLRAAGVELGRTYPRPILDLAAGRTRALEALGCIRGE